MAEQLNVSRPCYILTVGASIRKASKFPLFNNDLLSTFHSLRLRQIIEFVASQQPDTVVELSKQRT